MSSRRFYEAQRKRPSLGFWMVLVSLNFSTGCTSFWILFRKFNAGFGVLVRFRESYEDLFVVGSAKKALEVDNFLRSWRSVWAMWRSCFEVFQCWTCTGLASLEFQEFAAKKSGAWFRDPDSGRLDLPDASMFSAAQC